MRITKQLLKKKGACLEGIRWFEERFPKGGTLDELLQSEAARECPTKFVWWVYENIVQDKRLLALCGVYESSGVHWSNGVYGSNGVNWSYGVYRSYGVNQSSGVYRSFSVCTSSGVYRSCSVYRSFGCSGCQGIYRCLFCADTTGKYLIFNHQTEEERFNEVWDCLLDRFGDWKPSFYDGRNGNEILSIKEAWSGMPEAAVEYIKSLPEFDAELFRRITGIAA